MDHTAILVTAVATTITAVAVAGYTLVVLRAHWHERASAGTRKPVVGIKHRSDVTPLPFETPDNFEADHTRAVRFKLFNRSRVVQTVTALPHTFHVIWPRIGAVSARAVDGGEATMEPYTAAEITVVVMARRAWSELPMSELTGKYLIRMKFESAAGEVLTMMGRTRLYRNPAREHPHKSKSGGQARSGRSSNRHRARR